jgi:hypothetical protein
MTTGEWCRCLQCTTFVILAVIQLPMGAKPVGERYFEPMVCID